MQERTVGAGRLFLMVATTSVQKERESNATGSSVAHPLLGGRERHCELRDEAVAQRGELRTFLEEGGGREEESGSETLEISLTGFSSEECALQRTNSSVRGGSLRGHGLLLSDSL